MKKIFSIILVLTILMSFGIQSAFADDWKDESDGWDKGFLPPGIAKKAGFLPPGIAKKIFDDIEDYIWAKKAIECMKLKGLIKGYGDGIYAPADSVSKIQAVVMVIRIMGWESDAKDSNTLPDGYEGKRVGDWAKGYVSTAYDKGILDDVDLLTFDPNAPAKRYEVAEYIIKAIGYEDEAEDKMNEDLPFVDSSEVPQGSVGYVYLVNDMGLMQGDDLGRFNPMGTLTRAEMAVLFERLDTKVDSEVDEDEYVGKVYRIYDDKLVLKTDDNLKTFYLDNDVIIYDEEEERCQYSDIDINDKVIVQLEDDKVIYIELVDSLDDDKIITTYSGEVVNLDEDSIVIAIKEMQVLFNIIDDVEVLFEDEEGNFEDIEIDDNATVIVDDQNRARKIIIDRELDEYEEVEGILKDFNDDEIVIDIDDDEEEYEYDDSLEVIINGKEKDIENLEVGMSVELELRNNLVIKIDAEDNELDLDGIVDSIIYNSDNTIIKIDSDDDIYDFEIDDSLDISELEVGVEAEFEIVNNIIVDFTIEDEEE